MEMISSLKLAWLTICEAHFKTFHGGLGRRGATNWGRRVTIASPNFISSLLWKTTKKEEEKLGGRHERNASVLRQKVKSDGKIKEGGRGPRQQKGRAKRSSKGRESHEASDASRWSEADPLAGKYGEMALSYAQSKKVTGRRWTEVESLVEELKDEDVLIRGWVQNTAF
ncbi:aspartate--tRNA ligase 2, cytoplasmic-like protein [Cinnamomum micranthum f. kanehirae]|uniref:Aspartate--tRNA ligase 2, cytoplasmic-like protein n=1 Tax=Cinnamomum micranthum f. kanehirae TaxID=337451 RepID=A0A3S3PIW2_9MAGN|nr:aspartate--tRNA ligase 2, cytoplasmic-like protein [Cinnamomum micranthum f. kanehirae]